MAARHYSVPHFFRQVPNALLKRFFAGHELFGDLDFEAMRETKPEALLKAWERLAIERRTAIEPQLREIFDMSSESGFHAIRGEARWNFGSDEAGYTAFVEMLAAKKSHCERAMTTFLDHRRYWRGATRFNHADRLPYWRKRRGLPTKPATIDKASRAGLAADIGAWFRQAEGRGRNCHVDLLKRDQRDYFFVYPEDFAGESIEWVANQFDRRRHNPAFEVVLVWSASEGALDVNYRGSPKAREALQAIFARNVLKLDSLPPEDEDEHIYDLNPLRQRTFQFVFPPASGIDSVRVSKLRLSSSVRKGDKITLEADTISSPLALYDVVEQAGQAFPLPLWDVDQAEIVVNLAEVGDKPARRETFRIGLPNYCSLKYDGIGLKLRAMLVASGIEPQ